jgi:hypothetical protein
LAGPPRRCGRTGFKLSTDPLFVDKVVDVVGLYHNPPENAAVFCIDEKSRIQALDRSQPVLPMMPGMPERRTHDYARNGITSLFAAFNIADGTVPARCLQERPSVGEGHSYLAPRVALFVDLGFEGWGSPSGGSLLPPVRVLIGLDPARPALRPGCGCRGSPWALMPLAAGVLLRSMGLSILSR